MISRLSLTCLTAYWTSILTLGVTSRGDFPGVHAVCSLAQRLCRQVQVRVLANWDVVNEGALAAISADQAEHGVMLLRRCATLASQGNQASNHFYRLCLLVGG
jgi:hypothetical protein